MPIILNNGGTSSDSFIASSVTMLQIVQSACGEMGLAVPNYVTGNLTQDVVQLSYLLNAVGKSLVREYDWQSLQKEFRFNTQYFQSTGTTVSGSNSVSGLTIGTVDSTWMTTGNGIPQDTYVSVQTGTSVTLTNPVSYSGSSILTFGKTKYAMPSDYDRPIDRTQYDKSKRWGMLGPETPQQWQFLKSSYISTGPRIRYRIMGGAFQIWPLMSVNEQLGLEYVSNSWVADSSGAFKSQFTADTDVCVFPERLIITALKRAYFAIKGFGPQFDAEYNRLLSIAKANDGGSQTLAMAVQPSSVLVGFENIPDSGYGGI